MASYPPQTNVIYVTPQYVVAPGVIAVNDWMCWSIVTFFIGFGTGILPLIFSFLCRTAKLNNDAAGAQTMSTLALVFNIVGTVGGVIAWIAVIIVISVWSSFTNHLHRSAFFITALWSNLFHVTKRINFVKTHLALHLPKNEEITHQISRFTAAHSFRIDQCTLNSEKG